MRRLAGGSQPAETKIRTQEGESRKTRHKAFRSRFISGRSIFRGESLRVAPEMVPPGLHWILPIRAVGFLHADESRRIGKLPWLLDSNRCQNNCLAIPTVPVLTLFCGSQLEIGGYGEN
jgi:hypothetical protein